MAAVQLVNLSARHTPLLAQELGWYYHCSPLYGSSGRGEQPALIPDAEGMQ